jgi:Rrf2 family protein
MKLSRTVGYALRATLMLAQNDPHNPVPCSRLAAQGNMPERFLLQILRSLVTHGILQSTRGVDGGYKLGRPAGEISLLDIIEAVEGPLHAESPEAEGLPKDSLDQLFSLLAEMNDAERRQLGEIRISSLITQRRKAV